MKADYMMKKFKNRNDKYIIYEINLENLDINIYDDPNYEHGFYVIDNIEPKRIKIIDKE